MYNRALPRILTNSWFWLVAARATKLPESGHFFATFHWAKLQCVNAPTSNSSNSRSDAYSLGSLWGLTGPLGSLWGLTGPLGSLWGLTGPLGSLSPWLTREPWSRSIRAKFKEFGIGAFVHWNFVPMFWLSNRASLTTWSTTQAAQNLSLKFPDLSPSSGGAAPFEVGKTVQQTPKTELSTGKFKVAPFLFYKFL